MYILPIQGNNIIVQTYKPFLIEVHYEKIGDCRNVIPYFFTFIKSAVYECISLQLSVIISL